MKRRPRGVETGEPDGSLRVTKFEEVMAVANEAQEQAMVWMARTVEKHAERAESKTERAKKETAAFEQAMVGSVIRSEMTTDQDKTQEGRHEAGGEIGSTGKRRNVKR